LQFENTAAAGHRKMPTAYHPLVADDLAAAVAHYDNISVDLGNRFRVSVRNRIDTVSERPESFGRIHE
jgi:hypothetical protein